MKAVQITGHGAPGMLKLVDAPDPEPSDDQVLIKVEAAGINFADILSRQGLYADAPPPPFVPGYEVAGTIAGIGKDVRDLKEGDRVTALCGFGGYAEYAISVPLFTRKLADNVSFYSGAAVPVNWTTAYHSIYLTGPVNAGDRALVHAAAGATGIAAVKMLKASGCTVFGTAGSDRKVGFLKNIGVDYPINYREEDFVKAVKKAVGERALDLIIDSIGGVSIRKGLKLAHGKPIPSHGLQYGYLRRVHYADSQGPPGLMRKVVRKRRRYAQRRDALPND